MKAVRLAIGAFTCAVVGACSGDPVGIQPPTTSMARQSAAPIDEGGVDIVARVIALGMKNPALRSGVRDAMRASLITEHKLVFQEFAQTALGKAVLQAGSARLKMAPGELETILARLPALDFYVPSRAQRRNWTGESTIRVGFMGRDAGGRFPAYDVEGVRTEALAEVPQRAGATFVLQHAERASRRIQPQAAVPGSVIESMDDGGLSGSLVEYLPDGSTRVTDLADYFAREAGLAPTSSTSGSEIVAPTNIEPCGGGGAPGQPGIQCGGGGGGGGGGPADTTFMRILVVIDVCDNWDCNQGNEFEWHTYFSVNNGSTWTNRMDLRLEGIPSNYEENVNFPVLFKRIRNSYEKITSDVVETDSWGDDHFTPSPIWGYGQSGQLRSEGDSRCGAPKYYGGTYNCAEPPLYMFWREVNQNFVF